MQQSSGCDPIGEPTATPSPHDPSDRPVLVEKPEPGITVIRLNRPHRRNGLTLPLITALHEALDEIAADETCRAVVLTGAGAWFCAGADYDLVEQMSPRNFGLESLTQRI